MYYLFVLIFRINMQLEKHKNKTSPFGICF